MVLIGFAGGPGLRRRGLEAAAPRKPLVCAGAFPQDDSVLCDDAGATVVERDAQPLEPDFGADLSLCNSAWPRLMANAGVASVSEPTISTMCWKFPEEK